jgi:hypothetical protein
MSERVPADQIERIVGVRRHSLQHWGRAVDSEQTVYILHSQSCKDSTPDLRMCSFSIALDRGIDGLKTWPEWRWVLDRPVLLKIDEEGYLLPDIWVPDDDEG